MNSLINKSLTKGRCIVQWICLILFGAGALSAQTANYGETVRINFKIVSLDNQIESLYYRADNGWTPLYIPTGYPSGWFEYNGPAQMALYEGEPVPDAAGQLPPPVLQLIIPANTSEVLLLLFVSMEAQQKLYRGTALDFSLDSFPGGAMLIYNLTGDSIDGRIGQSRLTMPPNRFEFLRELEPDQPDGRCSVVLGFRTEDDNWKRAISTLWGNDKRFRIIRLLMNDPNQAGAIKVRTVYERVP